MATIDLKENEPGLLAFCAAHNLPLSVFSAVELEQAEGIFTPSAFVAHITGVDNVCERAAVCAGGTILVPKQAKNGVTVAVAGRKILHRTGPRRGRRPHRPCPGRFGRVRPDRGLYRLY